MVEKFGAKHINILQNLLNHHIPHCPAVCTFENIIEKVQKPLNIALSLWGFFNAGCCHKPE